MVKAERHDRHEAVKKATRLFWEKGFHATSMRNLQDYIDMRPGSIYASFGSKEGLFKEALRHYASCSQAQLQLLVEQSSPLQGLRQFVSEVVLEYQRASAPCSMCMLVKSAAELTTDNPELFAEANRLLQEMEVNFTALLTEAQRQGELNTDKDPRRLARWLQMQIMGLRTFARTCADREQVSELVDDVFDSLQR